MHRRAGLIVITLAGFGLRFHALGEVPLRWDEGWSIALASLAPRDIIRLTALDVHPPLYYFLLKPWLWLGPHELWTRAHSALAGVLAIPLAAAAARAWWGEGAGGAHPSDSGVSPVASPPAGARRENPRATNRESLQTTQATAIPGPHHRFRPWADVGLCAAAYVAIAPAFVYYAGVTRMYAMTTPLLLLAVWGLARWCDRVRPTRSALAAFSASLLALLTFYYAGIALAGVFVAALLRRPRAWRRLLGLGAAVALAYVPWLAVSVPPILARFGARTGGGGIVWAEVPAAMRDGLYAALFAYDAGWGAVATALAVLALGVVAARGGRDRGRAVAIAGVPVVAVLLAAAVGAQAHMFAPRYLIVATPFLALGLGWAVARLGDRGWIAGALAALALTTAVAPTLSGYVYRRDAEVDGPWDPAVFQRDLAPRTWMGDVVVFNILSVAGLYARYRTPDDPPWTYAQLWDPVHEPAEAAIARVGAGARSHGRTWLALYKGTVSPDSAALKSWADATLFPVEGGWAGDLLIQGYVEGRTNRSRGYSIDYGHGVHLVGAAWASHVVQGEGIAVRLTWHASAAPDANARVFVHAYGPDGDLIAQHDAFPAADTRPPKTWQAGETIEDRHGLWIPPDAHGPFELVVGLVDAQTGERWRAVDRGAGDAAAADSVRLGWVDVGEVREGDG